MDRVLKTLDIEIANLKRARELLMVGQVAPDKLKRKYVRKLARVAEKKAV